VTPSPSTTRRQPPLAWLVRTFLRARAPLVSVEVRPRAVSVVRLASDKGRLSLAAAVSTELPAGVLEVSLTKPNVLEPASLQAVLRATLERAGALAGGSVSLVLPDPAVRVALVPAAGLRGHGREAEDVIRFQLHKALPFDVRGARLAWRVLGEQALVAVAPDEVVAGYEDALEALGFRPGLVEAAALALTDAAARVFGSGDALLVNWDEGYVSFVVLRDGEPLLVRTLPGESGPDAVARHAVSTQQFHRDRLGGSELAAVIVRSAARPGEQALAVLGRALGREPRLVEPWAALGSGDTGDAAQAVAAAASCALRGAA
jgi:hypothetical protein